MRKRDGGPRTKTTLTKAERAALEIKSDVKKKSSERNKKT